MAWDWEMSIRIATLLSVVIGVLTVWAAVQGLRRQLHVQIFLAYTERFERIMESFPQAAWRSRTDSTNALPDASPELQIAILRYLNICAEEFYLHRGGFLSSKAWRIWEAELIRTLRSLLVRREWPALSGEFAAYPAFRQYVAEKMQ
jgi:hypothetical protein